MELVQYHKLLMCECVVNSVLWTKDTYTHRLVRLFVNLLSQAFAEELHERVRKEFWAYDVDEKLDTKQLHQIRYNVS